MTQRNSNTSRLSAATHRLSISSKASSVYGGEKRTSHREKKRMSMISATSLSSLSSYQQERMIARVSNLSSVLAQSRLK